MSVTVANMRGSRFRVLRIHWPSRLVTVLATAAVFFPLYMTLINSVKFSQEVVRNPVGMPAVFTWENYIYAFTSPNIEIFRMYRNSLTITLWSLALILFCAPMAGYYLARTKNKLARFLALYFLMGMMIPQQIVLIPLAKLYGAWGLIGKPVGMFLFYLASNSAFSIFLYSKFIKTIPIELEESALLDGASQFMVMWRILYPLLKPCTATALVFVGLHVWNDFLNPLILLGQSNGITITVGIYKAIGPYSADFGHVFAFVIVASLPILLLYLFMQRWFISGLTAGAVKG